MPSGRADDGGTERPGPPQAHMRRTLRLSYTPAFFSTSAQMGTVELTGLLRV